MSARRAELRRRFAATALTVVVAMAATLGVVAALAPTPAVAQLGGRLSGDPASVLGRIEEITERVERTRGLAADHPIPAGMHSRETLRDALIELIDTEYPPERFRVEGGLYELLGILPPATDYRELMVELLTSQIAGFYDDEVGELFILDDIDFATVEPTLAHEIFHGIQDQRFGIDAVRGEWPTADDALLAASALFEGDAVAVMIEYLMGGSLSITDIPGFMDMAESQFSGLDETAAGLPFAIPPFLMELLLFPYTDGLAFVHYLKSAGGWPLVDSVYLDPPLSTEQVLHPGRYLDRDAPTWLQFSPLAGEGGDGAWLVVYDQVFGELQLHALLSQVLADAVSERAIARACDGWDGDRLYLLEEGEQSGRFALAWLSVWDSAEDAEAFAAVLARFAEVRRGEALVGRASGPYGSLRQAEPGSSGDATGAVVERWGDMVLYLDGVPAATQDVETLERWRASAWQSRVRRPYERP